MSTQLPLGLGEALIVEFNADGAFITQHFSADQRCAQLDALAEVC